MSFQRKVLRRMRRNGMLPEPERHIIPRLHNPKIIAPRVAEPKPGLWKRFVAWCKRFVHKAQHQSACCSA